eukprot:scaffold1340_cov253-Pinguiococcus_pyrenoidosus.AAC.13
MQRESQVHTSVAEGWKGECAATERSATSGIRPVGGGGELCGAAQVAGASCEGRRLHLGAVRRKQLLALEGDEEVFGFAFRPESETPSMQQKLRKSSGAPSKMRSVHTSFRLFRLHILAPISSMLPQLRMCGIYPCKRGSAEARKREAMLLKICPLLWYQQEASHYIQTKVITTCAEGLRRRTQIRSPSSAEGPTALHVQRHE